MFRKLTSSILFAFLLIYSISSISSQGVATLASGAPVLIKLSQEAPINILALSGNVGDLVQIQTIALQANLQPRVSLQSPIQQPLTSSTLSVDGNVATLSYILTETGAYSLLIGGNAGDYLVSLSVIPTNGASALSYGADQEVIANNTNQVFAVNIPADGRSTVSISAGQFRDYVVSAFDDTGKQIATTSNTSWACFVVSPQSTLVLSSNHVDVEGGLVIRLGVDCGSGTSPSAPATQTSGNVAPINPTDGCVVVNSGSVNVRSGAGTNYGVITQLPANSTMPVVARANNEWVQIQSPVGLGFVSTTVVTLSGNCNNLPTISSDIQQPAPPTEGAVQPIQPTSQPNVEATQIPVGEATIAPTEEVVVPPTEEVIVQPTESPTDEPITPDPVAPADGNYTANINIDETTVVSDYVSYPGGDTEDTIFYTVGGLNNSVALPGGQADYTVVLTCSGNGTQYIQMEMQGSTYSCGQVASRRVNFDSNNGVIRIRATGGDATYVQWTLNVSAPRVP